MKLALTALALLALPLPEGRAQEEPTDARRVNTAVVPAHRLNEAWWKKRLAAKNERIAQGDVGLIFLGDSVTEGWESAGKEVWERYYARRKAINLGFSGDRTQHVLWRLEQHGLQGLAEPAEGQASPKLVVLLIGTNNSNRQDNTAEEIGAGIQAIVETLGEQLPRAKILILGIFPRGKGPSHQRWKNLLASEIAAGLADGERIHYLDPGARLLEEDGTLTTRMMPDLLHPSAHAYGIWAEAIEPKLEELLGED